MLKVVVDESVTKRIATELRNRGRDSVTIAQLQLRGQNDEEVLRTLERRFDRWVLLTADDQMPQVWSNVIDETGATVATIHPEYPDSYTENEWHHDVAHRWAHVICEQTRGTVRRYSLKTHRVWSPRKRRRS